MLLSMTQAGVHTMRNDYSRLWACVTLGIMLVILLSACDPKKSTDPDTSSTTIFLRDYEYLRNSYFWLFDPFTDTVWARYVAEGSEILEFQLYRSIQNFGPGGVEGDQAVCIPKLTTDIELSDVANAGYDTLSNFARSLKVELVDFTDYVLVNNRFYIVISDLKPINELDLLACYMTIQRPGGVIDTLGDISFIGNTGSEDSTLLLTLVKSNEGKNASTPTWLLEWKNVYSLGARDISIEGLKVDVFRGEAGTERQEGANFNTTTELRTPFLQILGLDLTSTDGTAVPDGEIDDSQFILDRARGHLFFPNSFPFAPSQYPIDPNPVYPFPFAANAAHGDNLPYPKVPDTATYSYGAFGEQLSYENLTVDLGLTLYGDTLEEQAPGIYLSGFADQRRRASVYYLKLIVK